MHNTFNKFRLQFREDGLFSVLLFTAFLTPLAFTLYTYENFETVKFGFFLILVGWALVVAIRRLRQGFEIKGGQVFLGALALFWLLGLLSTILSVDVLTSIFGFYYRFTNGLIFLTAWVIFLALLLIVLDREKFIYLIKFLIFDALAVSLIGIVQAFGFAYYEGLEIRGLSRSPGLLGNPNFSAMFIVSLFPLAVVAWEKAESTLGKIYYGVTVFFILWATVVFSSRGAWLGLLLAIFVSLIIFVWQKLGFSYIAKFFVSLLLFVLLWQGFLTVTRPDIVSPTVNLTESNVTQRLLLWNTTFQGIARHPFTGIGLGNFQVMFERERGSDMAGEAGVFDDAHNLFLHLAATGGVPLAIVFLVLILIALKNGWDFLLKSRDPYFVAAISAMIAFVVAAAFTPVAIPCFVLLAVLLAGLLTASQKQQLNWGRISKTTVGVVGGVFVIWGLSLIIAEHIFYVGYKKFYEGDYRQSLKLSKLAFYLNPTNQLYNIYQTGSSIKLMADPEQSLLDIKRIVALHPSQARSFVSAANLSFLIYRTTGEVKYLNHAIINLQESLKLDPYFAERQSQVAFYHFLKGDYPAAISNLKQSLILNERQFPSWMLLAKIYQLSDNRAGALFALNKAYHLKPDIVQVRYIWYWAKQENDIRKVPIEILVAQGKLE